MVNSLIKRKNLVNFLKEEGIKRVTPESLEVIEQELISDLSSFSKRIKEEMLIEGTKTLTKDVLKHVKEKSSDN